MILTGRSVGAQEALQMGLANYVVSDGQARTEAEKLAAKIAGFPRMCMRNDRLAVYAGFDLPFEQAMALEFDLGMQVLKSGESLQGAKRFVQARRSTTGGT